MVKEIIRDKELTPDNEGFSGVHFFNCVILDPKNCKFDNALFSNVTFAGDIVSNSFCNCAFSRCYIRIAEIRENDFTGAEIMHTKFEDTIIEKNVFSKAIFEDVFFKYGIIAEDSNIENIVFNSVAFKEVHKMPQVFQYGPREGAYVTYWPEKDIMSFNGKIVAADKMTKSLFAIYLKESSS